ncbi:S-layer homology domain-containing protein [Paenibacillus sp. JDR-2]|uniref:S-layer homology domain-containing protein n=1 Tax=Paenibacillus sp. (strain JDR-2) TaxID=324057 RepID=UPI000166A61F|nr:S-layer homology domain-containing protein [Paenibacillus sp. JDR-2]ACT00327.1 S-layer domain protein [Paenibacillus sp. JDR-2]
MLKRKLLMMLLSTVILFIGVAQGTVMAKEANATFDLKLSYSGKDVKLSIMGHGLTDMYAYDFELSYDEKILSFSKVETSIKGFSVDPILGANTIRIAHTKMGETGGEKGDVELSAITFKRIGSGTTSVKLNTMKLVDSKLDMAAFEPKVTATVIDNPNLLTFKDVKGHWAEASIYEAASLGFVTGYSDGTFKPNLEVTRAEFATMIVRALQKKTSDGKGLTFKDNKEIPVWARAYVQTAVEAKLITGYTDNTFGANKLITRSEMSAIIVRALAKETSSATKLQFADLDQIPAWAIPSVKAAVELGIMKGNTHNQFAPNAPATRAEAVTVILRMLKA